MADDELMRVLHALRLVGFGDTDDIARRSGYSGSEVRSTLEIAASSQWVTFRSGRVTGWSLTVVGRSVGESLLATEVAELDAADAVLDGYRRFRRLNQRFLDLCTDWQLRTGAGPVAAGPVVNDHTDQRYDDGVIARLGELDTAIQPIVGDLAVAVDRFVGYGPRLASARRRVEAGERDWFTRPVIDSYHTVWFELHEDLLATLGLDRTGEH